MKRALIILLIYKSLNVFATKRINKSTYISEEMRKLLKKFIWVLLFLGPLLIRNFWKQHQRSIQTNTKTERDKNTQYNGFYESGEGM